MLDTAHGISGLNAFGDTAAYRWLAEDNFKIARRFGFVPSYPAELPGQGPSPEPWEFIWVGDIASLIDATAKVESRNTLLLSARDILVALENSSGEQQPAAARPERQRAETAVDSLPGG